MKVQRLSSFDRAMMLCVFVVCLVVGVGAGFAVFALLMTFAGRIVMAAILGVLVMRAVFVWAREGKGR